MIERILSPDPPPFAVLYRPDRHEQVELLVGEVEQFARLADLPAGTAERPVLAVVPYRQIRERGFEAVDDGAPLLALRATERALIDLDDLRATLRAGLPDGDDVRFTPTGYDVSDADYERTVRAVLEQEIGAGAGSNFVIHRCLTGRFEDAMVSCPAKAALVVLTRLLAGESSAYWTFAVHTPDRTFVGATPERHVSLDAGIARMNPISGTLRYPAGGYRDAAAREAAVLDFLADPKERDELAMVVDEELKMMAVVGDRGGQVRGPYLKPMAHLAHTEYVIEGRTSMGPAAVLAATMFAPTVTGSPIRNACRVIARHERRGRGYYGGVLALIDQDPQGRPRLDAPILIRTAQLAPDGTVRVAAGATLVRGSDPVAELAETRAKAAAVVAALNPTPRAVPGGRGLHGEGGARVAAVLAERNRTLARFWLQEQEQDQIEDDVTQVLGEPSPAPSVGITVVNTEDDFTGMLALLLGSLGHRVTVHDWNDPALAGPAADPAAVLVLGPGPGDPADLADPRMAALHRLVAARLASRAPVLGICLGHQVLARRLGLTTDRLPVPDQGRQAGIDLFGVPHRVGFYNSFVASAPRVQRTDLEFSLGAGGRVHAVRGPALAGLQFHPESVLTTDGRAILAAELDRLLERGDQPLPRIRNRVRV